MSEFILHHYPPSPVSEKIRTGFGLKKLAWRSVVQNRLPDRPELFAMTGGYRRIPVLQIGADIYCDTQCILRELEARAPKPSFFPGGNAGLPYGFSRWTDGEFFDSAFRLALAPAAQTLPPEFVADRVRLYIGPDGDLEKEAQDLPHTLVQFRAQLGWLDTRLATGRPYLLGADPTLTDLLAWFIVWFVRGRYEKAEALFEEFSALNAWSERMSAIGHGQETAMTPAEALAVARDATTVTQERTDPRDPQGLQPGMTASVVPITDSGEAPVEGRIIMSSRDRIALAIENPLCGEVAVHFPRVGYRVTVIS